MLAMSEDTEKDKIGVSASFLTHGKVEYVPKKLCKTWNMKKIKINLFFNFIDVNNLSYCVLCNRTFSKMNMVPIKLQHHFGSNHWEFKENGITYFIVNVTNSLEASYKISYYIALSGGAHTIEKLIKAYTVALLNVVGWKVSIGEHGTATFRRYSNLSN